MEAIKSEIVHFVSWLLCMATHHTHQYHHYLTIYIQYLFSINILQVSMNISGWNLFYIHWHHFASYILSCQISLCKNTLKEVFLFFVVMGIFTAIPYTDVEKSNNLKKKKKAVHFLLKYKRYLHNFFVF